MNSFLPAGIFTDEDIAIENGYNATVLKNGKHIFKNVKPVDKILIKQ